MELKECIKKLNSSEECIKSVTQNNCVINVENIYIGDLLSHVMANGEKGALWLTVQRHVNVVAVAELNEFSAIVFVEGAFPEKDTIQKAIELDLPLFISELNAFSLSKKLVSLGF